MRIWDTLEIRSCNIYFECDNRTIIPSGNDMLGYNMRIVWVERIYISGVTAVTF